MVEVPVLVAAPSIVEKAKAYMKTVYLIMKPAKRKTKKYPTNLRLRIL